MNKAPEWSAEEDEFVRQNYVQHGARWVARQLGRTQHGAQNRANKLGLSRREKKDSLCWECVKWGTGSAVKCRWHFDGIPVPGWTVEPGTYNGQNVIACPDFEEWKR